MTADDLAFQDALLQGFEFAVQTTHHNALVQGRIGQYISVPLVILGSYWADPLWVRMVYAGLYFLIGGLVCLYTARLLRANIALYLFVLLVALLNIGPLKFNHLPPTAYPLLISIPLLMIISVKLWRQRYKDNTQCFGTARKTLYLWVMLIAMLMNEFALLFGSGLLLLEYAADFCQQQNTLQISKRRWWNLRPYAFDILIVCLVLVIYGAFRMSFPSSYEGNIPNGVFNGSAVARTLGAHILASTSITILLDPQILILTLTTKVQWLIAILFGGLSGVLLFMSSRNANLNHRFWPVIVGAILYAIYVSLPAAITQKYQDWCSRGVCVYIDSRVSYFALVIGFGLLVLIARNVTLRYVWIARGYRIVMALLVAGLASYTCLNNQYIQAGMREYNRAWDRARHYICTSGADPASDPRLLEVLDPAKLVIFHPGYPAQSYWVNYMRYYKEHKGCAAEAMNQSDHR